MSDVAKMNVVYAPANVREISVRSESLGEIAIDIYRPANETAPIVVIVAGYPDAGFQRMLGCRFKDMASTVDWARLIASAGMAAITYANVNPVADLDALLEHFRGEQVALWASSGNAPLALSALMRHPIRCAALSYGYMLDVDDAATKFGFANPAAGRSIADIPVGVPLFVARAGQDQMPGLNDSLDRFVIDAMQRNLPLTFVNHPKGPHAFDLFDASDTSRAIIKQLLAFLQAHLLRG